MKENKHWQMLSTPFVFLILFVLSAQQVESLWPKKKPFIDQCKGLNEVSCIIKKKSCVWNTNQYALCAEKKYAEAQPPQRNDQQASLADRFFEFSPGVHLAEGANQQWWYNLPLDECAKRCLTAASSSSSKTRCLSFDFYPFESPLTSAPWKESTTTGVCVLNSESKDLARLRSEDQGYTDAELLYKSHFTKRPFSELDGYYEIRDPRGGHIAKMLNYDGSSQDSPDQAPDKTITPLNLWPQTRWGIYHLYVPPPLNGEYLCSGSNPVGTGSDNSGKAYFRAGFTPIDLSQHCPGLMRKQPAADLCASIGGELCSSNELKKLVGKNIGCGYDSEDVWASSDQTAGTKFVRCCVTYNLVANCDLYTKTNLDFCSSLTTLPDCVQKGSGFVKQNKLGFGRLLDQMRDNCSTNKGSCSGLVSDWQARDKCLWCVEPGGTDAGACYPGNDYGICPRAGDSLRKMFELKIKTYCPAEDVCALAFKYPFLAVDLNVPTYSPTIKPTKAPTKNPTIAPTRPPTDTPTKKPTTNPSKTPTDTPTKKPTQAPTINPTLTPTKNPTKKPTNPPSSNPSAHPTKQPINQSTDAPTTSPTPSI